MSATNTVTQTTKQKNKKVNRLKVVSSKVSKKVQLHVGHRNFSDNSQTTREVASTKVHVMVKAEHHRNPSTSPRSRGNDTRRRPRTHQTSGTRTVAPHYPVYSPYGVPRRSPNAQRKQCAQRNGCSAKTGQASPPRRSRNVPNFPASAHNGGNRSVYRETISVPLAIAKRPTRERPVTSPAKRTLEKTKVADTKVPKGPFQRFFKDKVSLSMEEISQNSESVNYIIPHILDEVRKKDERFAMRRFNSGSYYERLKVSRPCEFDIMLVLDAQRIERFFRISCPSRLKDPRVGYAALEFKDHVSGGRKEWGQFLTGDGKYLSPRKTVKHFYDLVCEALKSMQTAQGKRVSNVRLNGPAVTLTLDGKIDLDLVLSVKILGWPQCSSAWGNFATSKTWPTRRTVEKIKTETPEFHLVAKTCSAEEGVHSDDRKYWRISFSEAEKTLLSPAAPGNEKEYYKIAKAIFEARKERFKPLRSYHLKTLFLHLRHERPRARGDSNNLGESVVEFFKSLIDRLESGRLQHFFVSNNNLFTDIAEQTRASLAREVKRFLYVLVQDPEKALGSLTI